MAAALAQAHDHALEPEQAEIQLRAGVDRWWRNARLGGEADLPPDAVPAASGEEAERLRQMDFVRRNRSGGTPG
jgi:hypothetical protein